MTKGIIKEVANNPITKIMIKKLISNQDQSNSKKNGIQIARFPFNFMMF